LEHWQGTAVGCGPALEITRTFVGQKVGSASLNPAFSKTWKEAAAATVSGQAPIIIDPAEMAVAVSGSVAAVPGFCEGDTPLFLMTGRWNDASMANGVTDWSCPPQALGSCASVTVRYGVVEITLSANNLSSAGASDATGRSWRRGLSHATAPSALEPIASNRMIRRSCREDLKSFPEDVRLVTGYVLYLAQVGSKHPDAKPLRGFGGAGALAFSRSSMTSTATRTGRSTRSSCKGLSSPFMPFRRSRRRGRRRPGQDLELVRRRLRRAEEIHAGMVKARGASNEEEG
jgi:hypothetical protein